MSSTIKIINLCLFEKINGKKNKRLFSQVSLEKMEPAECVEANYCLIGSEGKSCTFFSNLAKFEVKLDKSFCFSIFQILSFKFETIARQKVAKKAKISLSFERQVSKKLLWAYQTRAGIKRGY